MAGRGSFSHNSMLNLVTQLVVAAIALVCVPYIIKTMGTESFGLLALLWMIVGYFGILDLGVGQSSVKFVAESVSRGDNEQTLRLVWGIVGLSILLGLAGCVLAIAASFSGFERLLQVPLSLGEETRWSFRFLAICLPAVVAQGPLKSVLLAHNRFDITNLLGGLSGILQWGGSVLVLFFGGSLLSVVMWTVLIRYIIAGAYLRWVMKYLPGLHAKRWSFDASLLSGFIRYSGWVTVTQIVSPMIPIIERSLIAAVAGLAAVTYFSVPGDTVLRLVVIPGSLASTLLPVLSGKWIDQTERSAGISLYYRSIKHVLTLMIPIVFLIVAFRAELMTLWMGPDFANQTATIVGFFGVGILFHSLAQLPNAALHAIGRPDVTTKLLLVELPLYSVLCYLAVREFGPAGAAGTWFLRVTVEFLVLLLAARKILAKHKATLVVPSFWRVVALGLLCFVTLQLLKPYLWHLGAAMIVSGAYAFLAWRFLYDPDDRAAISGIVVSVLAPFRKEFHGT